MTTIIPGLGGERYTPYDERKGNESVVYFTRDICCWTPTTATCAYSPPTR